MSLGIFDSGVGGFSVLKKSTERHGDIPFIYLGDTARVPYGIKKHSEIRIFAKEIIGWFEMQGVSSVLVGCNTTNSLALDILQKFSTVPVFSLIDAAIGMICEQRVGILATPATVASNAYRNQIELLKPGAVVFQQSCPEFVPIIESGHLNRNQLLSLSNDYITPLLENNVEAIILGCSHYPLIQEFIKKVLPTDIRLIDPAVGMARNLDRILGTPKFSKINKSNYKKTRFCVTSDPEGFSSRSKFWLGQFPDVELVSLQQKACFL